MKRSLERQRHHTSHALSEASAPFPISTNTDSGERLRAGKLTVQRRLLARYERNHPGSVGPESLEELDRLVARVATAAGVDDLRGLEGAGSGAYFRQFGKMLSNVGFPGSKRRPATDPANLRQIKAEEFEGGDQGLRLRPEALKRYFELYEEQLRGPSEGEGSPSWRERLGAPLRGSGLVPRATRRRPGKACDRGIAAPMSQGAQRSQGGWIGGRIRPEPRTQTPGRGPPGDGDGRPGGAVLPVEGLRPEPRLAARRSIR